MIGVTVWLLEGIAAAMGWLGAAFYSCSQWVLNRCIRLLDGHIAELKRQNELLSKQNELARKQLELIKGGKF